MFAFLESPLNVLRLSGRILVLGLFLLCLGIYGAYLYDAHLDLPVLVSMHAMVIIGPTLLKIGYVMRLLAQRQLSGVGSRLQMA
ncbi:transmembrane sensor/regulator PpyR [Pseudomonas gingeri]|uniref:Transmembrane sensor/regulator PpyR n=1 Tax=Pseudomonas gingeri TaxID=117681 RepID=A0A7Y7YC10_9PSED|nr:transmembrane sensor/regulator PpyR [Pseudomonas gingeri]NWB30088.1 transmembrane sensor/regulator PpyR [Pseudomonas gingeri]NWC33677.1 transmembrane sensor/regulator PpyR [Pseudomonas gingeri]NWD05721.1 transmembrane sensor/regulator PpyR [Pseudomonas gingeri]NWD51876.1 transmembrane sensor/regulator PpyR [Pseudomonas gingeri]NWE32199.1 transmembrane sensor/regulator PpyR [Pseudomonas gingeri]